MTQRNLAIPWYARTWNTLKQFPQRLSTGAIDTPEVSGPAAAAFVSATFSCFLLMVNQHLTSIFKSWNTFVWMLGDWIPGSKTGDQIYGEIGSYTGKETVMLVGWLGSWLLLHQVWKNRQVSPRLVLGLMMFFVVAATVMNWHPLFPYLPLTPSK